MGKKKTVIEAEKLAPEAVATQPAIVEELAGGENFVFEFDSYNNGKVHVVVAPDETEAARLLAEHVFELKYATKLNEHRETCKNAQCGCKQYMKQFFAVQIAAYKNRKITKKFPVDDKPHVIGRNLDPMPTKEEMN